LVTRVPNSMKIRQCFLELQLKMSWMFFETQCRSKLSDLHTDSDTQADVTECINQ